VEDGECVGREDVLGGADAREPAASGSGRVVGVFGVRDLVVEIVERVDDRIVLIDQSIGVVVAGIDPITEVVDGVEERIAPVQQKVEQRGTFLHAPLMMLPARAV